jgi:hypothetical protein
MKGGADGLLKFTRSAFTRGWRGWGSEKRDREADSWEGSSILVVIGSKSAVEELKS